jgi:CRP/FNR family transcriptional regulator
MTPPDKHNVLRQTPLFSQPGETELAALSDRAVERRLQKGELLFIAGDKARGMFVIIQGALRAFREGLDGREQVIHVERAGATIAEVPVFDDAPYPSSVAAEEDCLLLFIDKHEVRRLCQENSQFALAALRLLAARLRKCAALVEALSLHEVDQRLARWLLGEARARGLREGDCLEINLALTHQQIAARIGTVREVISRALSRLQQNGLIDVDGRRIRIQDEAALSIFADS